MFLLRFLASILRKWILAPLSGAAAVLAIWAFHALVKASPGRAFELMQRIGDAYYTPPQQWASFISSYMERMTGGRIDLDEIIRTGGRSAMESLGETFLNPMLGLIMADPPMTPEKGIDAAERYLGVNLQFQMSAWFLHVLGDMMSFGIFKSLKDLPNAISWSFGLGWLSWLVMGTPFRKSIADPLDEHFNRVYKPSRLTVAQNIEAFQKGFITEQEFIDNMYFLGYDESKIEVLYNISLKDPGDANIKRLYELGVLSESDVKREIQHKGYSGAWADLLTQLITKDREIKERDRLLNEIENLYVVGETSRGELADAYSRAGWNSREVDLVLSRLDAEKRRRNVLSDSDLANAVEKGLMSYSEARKRLIQRGWEGREADIFLRIRIPEEKWL